MLIIGQAGRKQVGKSSFSMIAKILLTVNDTCPVLETSFASPLKKLCRDLFDLKEENVNGTEEQKNSPVGTWSLVCEKIRNKYDKQATDVMSGREILQIIGTDLFREGLKDTLWADKCIKKIKEIESGEYFKQNYFNATSGNTHYENPYNLCIITDVRFENEIKAIKSAGGKVVRMFRNTGCSDSIVHKSETELDKIPLSMFDYIIDEKKNENIATLTGAVAEILFNEKLYNYDLIKEKNNKLNGKTI